MSADRADALWRVIDRANANGGVRVPVNCRRLDVADVGNAAKASVVNVMVRVDALKLLDPAEYASVDGVGPGN